MHSSLDKQVTERKLVKPHECETLRDGYCRRKLGWLACILGIAWPGLSAFSANAAVEIVSFSAAPIPVNYTDREIQVKQFDPSLGTLESVSIEMQGTGFFSQFFEYLGESSAHLNIHQQLHLVLDTQQGNPILVLNQVQNNNYRLPEFDGVLDFGGSSGATPNYPVVAARSKTLDSPSALLQFTGSGFADLFLSARGQFGSNVPGGAAIIEGFLTAGANITIAYTYIPVPEASTWLVGGIALLGLALGSRSASARPSGDQSARCDPDPRCRRL